MKRTIFMVAFAMWVLAVVSIPSKAEAKHKNKKNSAKKAQKFASAEIDSKATKLPANYYGNDPEVVYSRLVERGKSLAKGEFETTEGFQRRVASEAGRPIVGDIHQDGVFAFQLERLELEYLADIASLKLKITMGPVFNHKMVSAGDVPEKALELIGGGHTSGKYTGANAYGAQAIVDSNDYKTFAIKSTNYAQLFPERLTGSAEARIKAEKDFYSRVSSIPNIKPTVYESDLEYVYDSAITVNPSDAKKIKDNIRALILVRIDSPAVDTGFIYRDATMDNTTSYTNQFMYICSKIESIWIYNQATGEIYAKTPRTGAKSASN